MNNPGGITVTNYLGDINNVLSGFQSSSIFVLVDEHSWAHCYSKLQAHLHSHHVIQIKSGEENKTIGRCEFIWQKLTEHNADRTALLINLGGGVIGDIGGFAASCYKRGIKFINIPTTLLAMVDASVGGKTGVDFQGYKNQIGLFAEPTAVFVYTGFLKTLSPRELNAGMAEVIKHYLIADKAAFHDLLSITNSPNWDELIEKNIAIKSAIVQQDPMEKNIRKALNFGHTIGHAIESYFLRTDRKLLHGEAVGTGMIAESFISYKQGALTEDELNAIVKTIKSYFKLPEFPMSQFSELMKMIGQDKKNEGQHSRFTLLNGIGAYSINNVVEEQLIEESLNYYNAAIK